MYRDRDQRDFARNLRKQMTEAEKRLWRLLRAQQLQGHKFRRQAAVGPYVVDFVCFSHKLIVELDGPQHSESDAQRHDARRSDWLASRGFRIIRFWNHQLDEEIHSVVESIQRALSEASSSLAQPPSPVLRTGYRTALGQQCFTTACRLQAPHCSPAGTCLCSFGPSPPRGGSRRGAEAGKPEGLTSRASFGRAPAKKLFPNHFPRPAIEIAAVRRL